MHLLAGRIAAATAATVLLSGAPGVYSSARGAPLRASPPTAGASPLDTVYAYGRDSGGGHADPETGLYLLFEPGGLARLLAMSTTEALSYAGTWSYGGGKLTLGFSAHDFDHHVDFPLDLGANAVTMPFQVFDSGTGTSSWTRSTMDLSSAAGAVYLAAAVSSTSPSGASEAIDEAYRYVVARLGASPGRGSSTSVAPRRSGHVLPGRGGGGTSDPPSIRSVARTATGIDITYGDGTTASLLLTGFAAGATADTLSPGQLASDPRVALPPKSPGDDSADPRTKTALLISPFNEESFVDYSTDVTFGGGPTSSKDSLGGSLNLPQVRGALVSDGYTVTELVDSKVTVEQLIEDLSANGGPGVVLFATHGNATGSLLTGEFLSRDDEDAWTAFHDVEAQLTAEGYGSLVADGGIDFGGRVRQIPDAAGHDVPVTSWYVGVTPKFWSWVEAHRGASFTDSLVYIYACSTDATPALRAAIRAKAYFAWNVHVDIPLGGAVFQYLVASLSVHTHSAEEAYYNLVRVARTDQAIYTYDNLLKGTDFSYITGHLDGWGYERSEIPYVGNGWLSGSIDEGQVWWMVFAGRWGQDSVAGANALEGCWKQLWGGLHEASNLAFPGCTNSDDGQLPTEAEVGYATYLLAGFPLLSVGNLTLVPRLTLHD